MKKSFLLLCIALCAYPQDIAHAQDVENKTRPTNKFSVLFPIEAKRHSFSSTCNKIQRLIKTSIFISDGELSASSFYCSEGTPTVGMVLDGVAAIYGSRWQKKVDPEQLILSTGSHEHDSVFLPKDQYQRDIFRTGFDFVNSLSEEKINTNNFSFSDLSEKSQEKLYNYIESIKNKHKSKNNNILESPLSDITGSKISITKKEDINTSHFDRYSISLTLPGISMFHSINNYEEIKKLNENKPNNIIKGVDFSIEDSSELPTSSSKEAIDLDTRFDQKISTEKDMTLKELLYHVGLKTKIFFIMEAAPYLNKTIHQNFTNQKIRDILHSLEEMGVRWEYRRSRIVVVRRPDSPVPVPAKSS